MNNLYARAVFFVENAERSLRFYVEQLGFSEDWSYQEEGRVYVYQVSLFGFELILNQIDDQTLTRAGHGRVFIGLEDDQVGRILPRRIEPLLPVRCRADHPPRRLEVGPDELLTVFFVVYR